MYQLLKNSYGEDDCPTTASPRANFHQPSSAAPPTSRPLPPRSVNNCYTSDGDGDGDVSDYIALSSYGGDVDFYVSSAHTPLRTSDKPLFSKRVLAFVFSSFVVKPMCCVAFYMYYRLAGISDFLSLGVSITLTHYAQLLLLSCFTYCNILADRLPLVGFQRAIVGLMSVSCPAVFASVSYWLFFRREDVQSHILNAILSPKLTDSGNAVELDLYPPYPKIRFDVLTTSCLLVVATVTFLSITICDAIEFLLPRIWVRAVMGPGISF